MMIPGRLDLVTMIVRTLVATARCVVDEACGLPSVRRRVVVAATTSTGVIVVPATN